MASNDFHGADRRQAPRVSTDLFGSVHGAAGAELRCRVVNVSGVGACAISPQAVPEMAIVRLRLAVRDSEAAKPRDIDVEAAVVRCQRRADGTFDLGLFFTKVKPEDSESLRRVVDQHTPVPVGG